MTKQLEIKRFQYHPKEKFFTEHQKKYGII